MSIVIRNLQRKFRVDTDLLQKQAQCIRNVVCCGMYNSHSLTIALITNQRMRMLNGRYAGLRKMTDVLSFRMKDEPRRVRSHSLAWDHHFEQLKNAPYLDTQTGQLIKSSETNIDYSIFQELGTVLLAVDYCNRMATRKSITLDMYLLLATTHGIAHLAGYDHQTATQYNRMKEAEQQAIQSVINSNLIHSNNIAPNQLLSYL